MNLKIRYANVSNYGKGRLKAIKYIVVHYTANDGDTDEGNGNYFSQPNRNASAHYFVDEDSVTQTVKDTDTAWHCGTKGIYYHKECRNDNSIGIELCSEKNKIAGASGFYFNEATVNNAVELIKMLVKKYNVPIDNVIRHYDVTHKICPEPFVSVPQAWDRFKCRISEEEKEMVTKANMKINGVIYEVDRILKDDANYIKVADLRQAGFEVGYDEKNRLPIISTMKI